MKFFGIDIKTIVLFLGFVLQIIVALPNIRSAFENEWFSFSVIFSIWLIIFTSCIKMLLKREKRKNPIISASNKPIENKNYKFLGKERSALYCIGIFSIPLLLISTHSIFSNPSEVVGQPANVLELSTRTNFDLVDVYNVHWVGGGAHALISNDSEEYDIPLATIFGEEMIRTANLLDGQACALAFELVNNKYDWVSLDKLQVTVTSYSPVPKYSSIKPLPFEQAEVYYLEINDPKVAKSDTFQSSSIIKDGQIQEISTYRLQKNKPQSFIVRINAKTPGIYIFEIQIIVRYKDFSETVTLTEPVKWLFDGTYN